MFLRLSSNLQFQQVVISERCWKWDHPSFWATSRIFGYSLSCCSDADFLLVSISDNQIISKFILHTMEALLRMLISELFLWRRQRTYWNHLALLTLFEAYRSFYFQRVIAWTFVEKGQCLYSIVDQCTRKNWHTINNAFYHVAWIESTVKLSCLSVIPDIKNCASFRYNNKQIYFTFQMHAKKRVPFTSKLGTTVKLQKVFSMNTILLSIAGHHSLCLSWTLNM